MEGFSKNEWETFLGGLAANLRNPARLCVIGSFPCIMAGQSGRGSIDLDTLRKASSFSVADMKQACEKSGIEFDPSGFLESGRPYIQLIDEGIVQTGDFHTTSIVFKDGNLQIERPPIENLIASKLIRSSEKDLEDIAFLIKHFQPDCALVGKIVRSFPKPQFDSASENLVYLKMLGKDVK